MRVRAFRQLTVAVLAVGSLILSGCGAVFSGSQAAGGFPAVSGGYGETPKISDGSATPPAKLLSRVLVAGTGAEITEDSMIVAAYTGKLWNGDVFDTTFKDMSSPSVLALSEVIAGWRQGLIGKHVGDRVQLVIPPDLAYGDQAQTGQYGEVTIPAGSTLVYVVDIHDQMSLTDISSIQPANATLNTDVKLPEGITVTGELGQKPVIRIAEGTKPPASIQVYLIAEGKGEAIDSDNYVAMHITEVTFDGQDGFSSYDDGVLQRTRTPVNTTVMFLGMRLGSRALVLLPEQKADKEKGNPATPASAEVIDYVAKVSSK